MLLFTPAEKRAVLIIVLVILSACVYQILLSYKPNPLTLDYKEQDSLFIRVSTHAPVNTEEEILTLTFKKIDEQKSLQTDVHQIDLNTASKTELQTLPRIGPAMARRILEYRKTHGKFSSLEDLMEIKGIGKKTFEKIKPYLTEIR